MEEFVSRSEVIGKHKSVARGNKRPVRRFLFKSRRASGCDNEQRPVTFPSEVGRITDHDRVLRHERVEVHGCPIPLGVVPAELAISRGEMEKEDNDCENQDNTNGSIDCPVRSATV